jgi:D-alanine--poly(phosphoribitol) ligase subunit 1
VHLLDQIDRWRDRAPDRAAHVSGDRVLTYRELCASSDQIAARLADGSIAERAPVVVHGHKEPEMLIAFLAAVKSGRPYCPIDTAVPSQRFEQIVQSCEAALVLTPETVRQMLAAPAPPAATRRVAADDPFYVLFTSGSTGEPKGVIVTLANLTAFVAWMESEHGMREAGEVFLNQAPFSFDLSVMDLYLSLATGGTLFSVTRDEIANLPKLYRALAISGVTTWVSTPSFAQMCLAERSFNSGMLPAVRRFLFCGETLWPDTATRLLDRFPAAEVWNTYGPTETTVATTSIRIDSDILARYSPLPIGRPMAGTRVCVVDPELRAVGDDERGEIVIAGPNVTAGYINRPDLTVKVFFPI